MSEVVDVFSLPAIVIDKVQRSEIMLLLRDRVNNQYMPTSTGNVQYNSKPDYTNHPNPQFPDFPDVWSHDQSGYFCLQKPEYQGGKEPIFFNLRISQFQIVVNLQTLQTIIRLVHPDRDSKENDFVEWTDPLQRIPLMRDELRVIIDIYG